MRKLIFVLLTLVLPVAFAKTTSNDVTRSDRTIEKMSPSTLRKQFELRGEILVMSPDGEVLYSVEQELRQWKFSASGNLTSRWFYSSEDIEPISLQQVWKMDNSGRFKVNIKQFGNKSVTIGDDGKVLNLGRPIKEKTFTLKNFEPITWEVYSNKKHKVIVRITPSLNYSKGPEQIGKLPISAKDMIAADNKGFVWTQDTSFTGEYITLKTSRGTIHMSYLPFQGSKEIGYAEDNKMRLKVGKKHYLRLISNAQFLPVGMQAKVFGKFDLKQKVAPGTTHVASSSDEAEFLPSTK